MQLCIYLYSAEVISHETKQKVFDMTERDKRVIELLNASERKIRSEPEMFNRFVTELKKIEELHSLGEKLLNTCGKCDK